MSVDTLFGAPLTMPADQRARWISLLTQCWINLIGGAPEDLGSDLEKMAPYFGTGASARALRAALADLPVSEALNELPEEVVLDLDGQALITPEGRILLAVLMDLELSGGDTIGPVDQMAALARAVKTRFEWQRRWLHKQFHGNISAPVLGAALFLAVNGSIGEDKSLLLPRDEKTDREIGDLVLPLVAHFSEAVGGQIPETARGIRRHWAFTQLSRLMRRDVERISPRNDDAVTFIRDGRLNALLDEVSARLASVPGARVEVAVTKFIADYRAIRGALAVLGQMHEDPTNTRRVASRITRCELRQ
ncbi:hypothetical protein MSIMFB_03888 [Mycobacterium simulans]|uniref:Uncharacterized protein n=1 Tax=Mycobacterium simulans TaxID=627089 RepID=A0A7Z7NB42_9MYCO|nr:hypothetical protein [Mycobacterium simulans]SOJ56411.1 hypothetical protein MSIMFB_03888 [Mycobacterium simulans]